MKQGVVYTILLGAIGVLGFFQIRSCKDTTVQRLSADRDSLAKKNDSVQIIAIKALAKDSITTIKSREDSFHFIHIIDSINGLRLAAVAKANTLQVQLNQTVSDLSSAVSAGDTASQRKALVDLRRQLEDLNNQVGFERQIGQDADSAYTGEIGRLNNIVSSKDSTITELKSALASKQLIIQGLIIDLDTAIATLNKRRKIPWITGVIGAVAGIFLGSHIK